MKNSNGLGCKKVQLKSTDICYFLFFLITLEIEKIKANSAIKINNFGNESIIHSLLMIIPDLRQLINSLQDQLPAHSEYPFSKTCHMLYFHPHFDSLWANFYTLLHLHNKCLLFRLRFILKYVFQQISLCVKYVILQCANPKITEKTAKLQW